MRLFGVGLGSVVFLLLAAGCGRTTTITGAPEPVAIRAPENTPVFPEPELQPDTDDEPEPGPSPEPSAVPSPEPSPSPSVSGTPIDTPPVTEPAPKTVRVLVFPHLGRYTTPQGREQVVNKVRLISEGDCRSSRLKDGALATTYAGGVEFSFSTALVKEPLRVECDLPLKIIREFPLKNLSYAGTFEIHPAQNQLKIVNILSLEEYLRGVVPSEMPGSWSREALKVQAVAARTYAAFQVHASQAANKDALYDLDDTVQFQAYQGISAATANSDRAIRETENLVLVHGEKLIVAFFSSDSGGHTEDARNVFGRAADAYCKGKNEVYALSLGPKAWTVDTSLNDLQNKLVSARTLKTSEKLRSIEVDETSRLASGRATRVRLTLETGAVKSVTAQSFAAMLGLQSRMFSATSTRITGRGFGHGVGMAQWGAKILADRQGWDYAKILGFYYTGVKLCPLGADARCAQAGD